MNTLPQEFVKVYMNLLGSKAAKEHFDYWMHWQKEYEWSKNKFVFEFENFELQYQGLLPLCGYTIYLTDIQEINFDIGLN